MKPDAIVVLIAVYVCANAAVAEISAETPQPIDGEFRWNASASLLPPKDVEDISCYSIKDPSIVRYKDRWHLFCTIRGKQRSHAVVYLTFADWKDAPQARRHLLSISMRNVSHPDTRWTDSISHGELLRDGYDERLEVDAKQIRFLFQGVLDRDRRGKPYGQIPWSLGILEPRQSLGDVP